MPTERASREPLLIAQVALAAALPWLTARWLVPGQGGWTAAVTLGVCAFAALHRQIRWIWALPASALLVLVVTITPGLPEAVGLLTGVVALLAAGLVIRGLVTRPVTVGPSSIPWAVAGWALVLTGVIIAVAGLLSVRSTDAQFAVGQAVAAEVWDSPLVALPTAPVPSPSSAIASNVSPGQGGDSSIAADAAAAPLAQLAFRRPGDDRPPVTDGVLYVGADVTEATLAAGPGHYPSTSRPGRAGNFAVAGHRTGWGSPFLELDELRAGDEVLVTARNERTFTYVVSESVLVDPDESWVLGRDPLGTGRPTLTLTTCDPPNVNDRRLVVFGTLAEVG